MRIAIVHDWLYTVGGAERVLASMLRCFPQADLFCLFDFLEPAAKARLGIGPVRTSFLQHMPGMRRRHRLFLPLMPLAIEQLDLSAYDVVLSSSYAVAKGVLTGPDQLHVSYVHSPMRYAWDLQHQYLRESRLDRGLRSALARLLLHNMRLWDVRTAHGVNAYLANSHFVARRIRKTYGRDAAVVPPPVRVSPVHVPAARGRAFLAASRLVPYKNIQHIVDAFRMLPEERLMVAGVGPELESLRARAGANVTFLGFLPDAELRARMAEARALIFAAEEDFGIVMAEVQGQGTPVLALGRGGAREIVIADGPQPTGMFFDQAEPGCIAETVRAFIATESRFSGAACHANALRFSEHHFETTLTEVVEKLYGSFRAGVEMTAARRAEAACPARDLVAACE